MKIFVSILYAIAILASSGCHTVMQAKWVSMTKRNHQPDKKLVSVGGVEAKFCTGDEPKIGKTRQTTGLMDEVIFRAQGKVRADFIKNPVFVSSFTWHRCVDLEGEGFVEK